MGTHDQERSELAASPSTTSTVVRAGLRGAWAERVFAVTASIVIVVAAVTSEPAGTRETIALLVAAMAYAVPKFISTIPDDIANATVIVAVGVSLVPDGRLEVGIFLVVLVVLESAARTGPIVRSAAALAAAWGMLLVALSSGSNFAPVPWFAACGFTFVLGLTIRRQQQLIDQLEQARRTLAEAAVAEERRRIARELHDLAGHTLAATLLHVTGARHVLRRDIDEAERALAEAEKVGRAGLDQVRGAVVALRTSERGTDPPLATPAGLSRLIDDYRKAGLAIDDTIAPEVASLQGPVGTAVHRITGEALANVARHAPDNRVELRIGMATDDERSNVTVLVADHGRRPAVRRSSGGFGLIGMEERARGLGGTFTAGSSPDGWRLEAAIPLPGGGPR